ncbi:MAG: orotidine-5'-phosphate decarboxylase [Bacteroidales bacterium]
MNARQLFQQIKRKKSFLCVGLDADLEKIPPHLLEKDDPVFEFNRYVVEATAEFAVAFKPNLAFYESLGPDGWRSLRKTVKFIRRNYPGIFLIADAKRGDIGNTSEKYARTFFDYKAAGLDFDAVTLSPYMGQDSVVPFLAFPEKWLVILALTSNPGANDFQNARLETGEYVFEKVIKTCASWTTSDRLMFVVGATRADSLVKIRQWVPDHFLLVPGVGAQGGSLAEVAEYGMNRECGLLVNSSRAIIYADHSPDFAAFVRVKAIEIQQEMEKLLTKKGIL